MTKRNLLALALTALGCAPSIEAANPPLVGLVILGDSTSAHLKEHTALLSEYDVRFVDIAPGNKSLQTYAQQAASLDLDGDILLVLAGGHDFLYNKQEIESYARYATALKNEYHEQRKGRPSVFVWFDTSVLCEWDPQYRVDEWHLNEAGYKRLGSEVGLW